MKIAYVRTNEAYDRCYVTRDDGSEDAFRFHAHGGGLPHELVHYGVEVAFGLQRGLWGSVASGLDLARANEHANRVGGKDKYADGFGGNLDEVVVSEGLTNVPWLSECSDDECRVRVAEHLPSATIGQVQRARTLLRELQAQWATLGAKRALNLDYPPT